MTVNTDSGTRPQLDLRTGFIRPWRQTKRAALILAVGNPLVGAASIVLFWATDHLSASNALLFVLVGLSGPVVVLGRYLVTGRLDVSPRQR